MGYATLGSRVFSLSVLCGLPDVCCATGAKGAHIFVGKNASEIEYVAVASSLRHCLLEFLVLLPSIIIRDRPERRGSRGPVCVRILCSTKERVWKLRGK